ncbi:MAG: potassium-transporting ATPase subunit KdpC [Thermodesulfobacteriota bacterium]
MKHFFAALRLLLIMTVLTGLLYPLAITGIVQAFFPYQASGSIIMVDGKVKGSELVGQKFVGEFYFWDRPSAIDYNPMPSGATNLSPTSEVLQKAVQQRRAHINRTVALSSNASIPVDMLFASASGVDPHISPQAARLQIERIAKARGFTPEQKTKLADLIERFVEPPQCGILGEHRVNVFLLNVALNQLN